MSNVPGLFLFWERPNFPDHGANRLGASALMQGLPDGNLVIPCTIGDHLATTEIPDNHPACKEATDTAEDRIGRLMSVCDSRSVDSIAGN